MDAAGDSGPDTGEAGGGDSGEAAWQVSRVAIRVGSGGAEVGVRVVVLQATRGEPGPRAVPEAVEQFGRRLQED